jgi:hypothetical protein
MLLTVGHAYFDSPGAIFLNGQLSASHAKRNFYAAIEEVGGNTVEESSHGIEAQRTVFRHGKTENTVDYSKIATGKTTAVNALPCHTVNIVNVHLNGVEKILAEG